MVIHSVHRPGACGGAIQAGGLTRTYRLHLPPSYDETKPISLILAFHGGGGQGRGMEKLSGFSILSDLNGFVVVYPDAFGRHWNDDRGIQAIRSHRLNIDDVGFISVLIEKLMQTYNIDPKRIYATGISNGGFFCQRLACQLSHKIAAIAIVASLLPENFPSICKPMRPISVLIISGTKDPFVPWKGGNVGVWPINRGKVLSVYDTVRYWATQNSCSLSPVITGEVDKDPQDGIRVRQEAYSQGKAGTEVILYAIEGGGHTWPGGPQYLPERIIGKTSRDIKASEVIWDFFVKHPME